MEERDSEVPLAAPPLTVGILYNLKRGAGAGAPDAEAEFDSMDTVRAIQSALEEGGARTVLMEADASLPARLQETRIDIAFNIAEGIGGRGREAQVPALLGMMGIPHTGSDETTLCMALDKALAKRLLATYRVRTPRFVLVRRGETPRTGRLRYPVIVKPNAEGSSKGISDASVVRSAEELRALLGKNFALYDADMLAEEYIEGREFTVGLLGNGSTLRVFEPMEILYRRPTQGAFHVYSYPVKQNYREYVDYACPAGLTDAQREEMKSTARRIFESLGCLDFARVDFRLSEDGRLYFIEINPLPGLAPHYSDYPMLAEFCGVSHRELVRAVLRAALARCGFSGRVCA